MNDRSSRDRLPGTRCCAWNRTASDIVNGSAQAETNSCSGRTIRPLPCCRGGPEANGFIRADEASLLFSDVSDGLRPQLEAMQLLCAMRSDKGFEMRWSVLEMSDVERMFELVRSGPGGPILIDHRPPIRVPLRERRILRHGFNGSKPTTFGKPVRACAQVRILWRDSQTT